jgi:hypothetical protein
MPVDKISLRGGQDVHCHSKSCFRPARKIVHTFTAIGPEATWSYG